MCGGGGNPISKAVNSVKKGVSQATGALQGAVGNVTQGAQGVVKGVQQVGSGDLRGLQTIGGAVVNTGSGLVGNSADLTRASIDALYGAPGMGMLKGTPLDGMIRGNLKGAVGSAEGMIRGNVAGIQDLPTDIGKGAQHVLDQAGNIVGEIGKGLGGLLGGGGGGGGTAGGISAPQYYKDLAKKQAEYGMNLPDQFQKYEGERFTAPSDRTTAAETAIYNNNKNSQQAAFDRAGQLMNQGSQYTSTNPTAVNYQGVSTKGPQSFSGSQYNNANTYSQYGTGLKFADEMPSSRGSGSQLGIGIADRVGAEIIENDAQREALQALKNRNRTNTPSSPQGFRGGANTEPRRPDGSIDGGIFSQQSFGNANAGSVNPNANLTANTYENRNRLVRGADYGNANTGTENVNAAQASKDYNNAVELRSANKSLTPAKNYDKDFQGLIDQQYNPYEDQVINQTISDLDRARQIANQGVGGQVAKAGAFGSRGELLKAENNRNFYDRVAAASGQLRQQGYESAAGRAQQEALQRLGLTASDVQNVRGLESQGNLQAQNLTAQGALQAQRLSADSAQQAAQLQSQGALAAQGLLSEGAMQGQRLTASADQQAQALQSQGALQSQNLTASDAQNVRGLQSQGALQTQNLLSQGALQGQNLTAGDLRDLRGALSSANLQGQRLTADSQNLAAQLGAQSYNQAADRELQALLNAQNLGATSAENQQRNALTNAYNQAQFGQAANNAALSAAQLQGQLGGQMDDRTRQQMYDQLQMGQNQDARNQAQADFNYQQFIDETQNFPQQYLANLNNAGGLGSRLIYTQQPTQGSGGQKGGLAGILGGALSGAAAGGPWGALIGGGLGALGAGVPQNMSGLSQFGGLFGDAPVQYNNAPTLGPNSGFGPD